MTVLEQNTFTFDFFFTSIYRLSLSNVNIDFGQNFKYRVFTQFICFEITWVQNSSFRQIICSYVCIFVHAWMWLGGKYSALYASKHVKNFIQYSTTKMLRKYFQVWVKFEKQEMGYRKPVMRLKVNILKTTRKNYFKLAT